MSRSVIMKVRRNGEWHEVKFARVSGDHGMHDQWRSIDALYRSECGGAEIRKVSRPGVGARWTGACRTDAGVMDPCGSTVRSLRGILADRYFRAHVSTYIVRGRVA